MSEENKSLNVKEIENPALVYAMHELKSKKTKDAEIKFVAELGRSTFITPAIIEVKDENGEYQRVVSGHSKAEDTKISFMLILTEDKKRYLPAFTSISELKKWQDKQGQQTVICNFEQYINYVTANDNGPAGLVIDPYGSNLILSRDLLMGMRKAIEGKVFIGDFNERPEAFEKALSDYFDEKGIVEQAFLLLMKKGNEVRNLLVVDYDKANPDASKEDLDKEKQALFNDIAEVCKPYLKDINLSIADFDEDFGKKATENKLPFYTR